MRPAAKLLKRLGAIEQRARANQPIVVVPEKQSAEDWSNVAVLAQQRLKDSVRNGDVAPD